MCIHTHVHLCGSQSKHFFSVRFRELSVFQFDLTPFQDLVTWHLQDYDVGEASSSRIACKQNPPACPQRGKRGHDKQVAGITPLNLPWALQPKYSLFQKHPTLTCFMTKPPSQDVHPLEVLLKECKDRKFPEKIGV